MTGLGQSDFLQALGWATLNSIWQMALLWCSFVAITYLFKLSAQKKYLLSVGALFSGSAWFIISFILFYNGYFSNGLSLLQIYSGSIIRFLPEVLTAASITYLLLLVIPARNLFTNWRKLQHIRTDGLTRVDVRYRLFVKQIAVHLGITKNVGVYFSEFVKSPLTIGFLKPLVLLPVASVTNLTPQQVEAVLLHELSHIKRFDYPVNILVNIIHTALYFNPFARFLIRIVQEERENCCDQMVLQFGYDKVSYASALLSLEKTSLHTQNFVLGAAGRRNLLGRIEKIVGVEKKFNFQLTHFLGIIAALFCIVVFNSLLIVSKGKKETAVTFNEFANPFYFFEEAKAKPNYQPAQSKDVTVVSVKKIRRGEKTEITHPYPLTGQHESLENDSEFMHVAYKEPGVKLSSEKEEHIKTTLEKTKKVLATYEWKEVENSIADGLTPDEKASVRQEYLREVKELDWENMEKNLQAVYDDLNWKEIDGNLNTALSSIRLDSLQKTCEQTLRILQKVQAESKSLSTLSFLPFPDESIDSLKKRELEVQTNLNEIKQLKEKKVIKL